MKPSEPFTAMAEKIERNPDDFGGAYVIVPPVIGGEAVSSLTIRNSDPSSTAVHFWAMLQVEVKAMLDKLQEQERNTAGFGRR